MEIDVTTLIAEWQGGNQQAFDRLSRYLYQELHRIAEHQMRGERRGHTLQTTALVNEAYMRLNAADLTVENRRHFLSLSARTMRRILVDHARARDSEKRGQGLRAQTLDEAAVIDPKSDEMVLEIDIALEKLAALDAPAASAIELLYFGGYTYEESADILGVSRSALFENARFAKVWLGKELSGD